MKNSKTLVALVAILIIIAIGFAYKYPKSSETLSVDKVVSEVKEKLKFGSVSGPDIQSPYLSVDGVTTWYVKQPVRTATSTLCSIKTPAATSTIKHLSANLSTTASYATQYLWGMDTAANNATTTSLASIIGAGAGKAMVYQASSTVNDLFTGYYHGTVPPNVYLNLNLSTSTAGASATYAPAGNCVAVFTEL